MKSQRHRARQIALQALYEIDLTDHAPGQVLQRHLRDINPPLPAGATGLLQAIIEGVMARRDDLDRVIAHFAPEWPVPQIATIDRNILRIALWEMNFNDTPSKVAINEAVELAKEFGAETSSRFINGVLGAATRQQGEMATILAEASASMDR
ncbi:MAG TPA: transcription antitermination factor NusB [Anaerolineae bacterium]|nr:transcription antitermination factor NusB [Caldilineae bacterium]HID35111.1 transcription antitermination factor NusB [Anaerolineae bacterium]HIQ11749.1 transcription antitermination factor NusB [Caldilineales bacterium]